MKQKLEAVSRLHRLLVILVLFCLSIIFTSYSMYADQQQKIAVNLKAKQDIKQEIRTFLESVNPEILRRIDAGQQKILTALSTSDAVKLSNLSERVDFDKYLSVKQVTLEDGLNGIGDPNIVIENNEYLWINHGHYLYPKDALVK